MPDKRDGKADHISRSAHAVARRIAQSSFDHASGTHQYTRPEGRMQIAPIRESMATSTQYRVSEKQVPSDNVGAGVLARASKKEAALVDREKRITIVTIALGALISVLGGDAQTARPEILQISPTSGPEGSRVEVTGRNLQQASAVCFGSTNSSFTLVSPQELIALVPHKSVTANITVVTPRGRAASAFAYVVANDPRVPDEVSYKAGYINPVPPPRGFKSALLWGIAIADTRTPGHESAEVEIASTQLTCRVDGKDVI